MYQVKYVEVHVSILRLSHVLVQRADGRMERKFPEILKHVQRLVQFAWTKCCVLFNWRKLLILCTEGFIQPFNKTLSR